MEIMLSRHAGFCQGVRRAYEMVVALAENPQVKKPLLVLGSLVHNQDVVKSLEQMGVEKISPELSLEEILQIVQQKNGTLLITAHGIGPKIYKMAEEMQVPLVDTTCPKVIKVQRLAKAFREQGAQIVLLGERDHKEMKGIFQWAEQQAQFVENAPDLEKLHLDPQKEIVLLSQTTQDQDFVRQMAEEIQKRYPKVRNLNSICDATQERQTEIKQLAQIAEMVVVIGSPESANSRRLWEIAGKVNPQSYFVENAAQLQADWFKNKTKVAVGAGASTPDWVIQAVLEKIQTF